MNASPSLEERVSTVEKTVERLVTSLPLPDATVRRLRGDVVLLNRELTTVRQGIVDLSIETHEIQETLAEHSSKLDEHGRVLADHGRILNEHGETLNEHGRILNEHTGILNEHTRILNEHTRILNEHGETLKEHGRLLRELASTLKLVVAKLDAR